MNGKLHYIVMQILNQLSNNRRSNQLLQHVKYIIYISFYYIYIFFYLIKLSLRVWCEEYIRRIDASFGKELRTWICSLTYSQLSNLLSFSIHNLFDCFLSFFFLCYIQMNSRTGSTVKINIFLQILRGNGFSFLISILYRRLIVPYKR